jgi:hypothetical protein
MSDEPKRFVVRAVNRAVTLWISPKIFIHNCRTLTSRDTAATFNTREQAQAAVTQLPGVFKHGDWTFHVDPD